MVVVLSKGRDEQEWIKIMFGCKYCKYQIYDVAKCSGHVVSSYRQM